MLRLREDPTSFRENRQDASRVSKILEWQKIFNVFSNTMLSKLFWKIISTYNSVLIQSISQGRGKMLVLLAIVSKKLDILSFHVALHSYILSLGASQVAIVVKNLPANAGDIRDVNLIPGLGRSPGIGNGNPLQYSCLENSMEPGSYSPWGRKESDTTEHIHVSGDLHSTSCTRWPVTAETGTRLTDNFSGFDFKK